jgi:hypothetical protein
MVAGCSSDDSSLVTVTGSVVNIDTSAPAEGVVVSLLGRSDLYASATTGPDGLFTLEVPAGSAFELVTNDWGGLDKDTPLARAAVDDHWLTFINVDPALATITDDTAIVVHACPTAGSPHTWNNGQAGLGSAAVWQNFLESSTTAPQYTDAVDLSGKIVVFFHFGTPPNNDLGIPVNHITGTQVDFVEQDFGRMGYWSVPDVFNFQVEGHEGSAVQDASVGPDMFTGGAANGPGTSVSIAIANQAYSDDTVTLTLVDTDGARNIDFSSVSPLVVPVRDQAATFVALGSVDNVVATITEGICATGRPLAVCQ